MGQRFAPTARQAQLRRAHRNCARTDHDDFLPPRPCARTAPRYWLPP
jgi:hypothetical protein